MDTGTLDQILSWMKTTDILELGFKQGSEGFDLRLENAPIDPPPFPAANIIPVTSPGVGIFKWSIPGTSRHAEEGKNVSAEDALGVIETGTKPISVTAGASGKLVKIIIEDGKPVEYGQPLFLIKPS